MGWDMEQMEATPSIQTAGELFRAVQEQQVFPDSKTFVDCVPRNDPDTILEQYREQCDSDGFSLTDFIHQQFILPADERQREEVGDLSMEEYIDYRWDLLTRTPDQTGDPHSTLIPLQNPHIVPGGRFREIFYWDTYFICLGLLSADREQLVVDMADNLASLIDQYGFVPNGNRTYYLSRSQPPVFTLLLELLEGYDLKGVTDYLPALEREYAFWMDGADRVNEGGAHRRVVQLEHTMNRYWDDQARPRPESYREDTELADILGPDDRPAFYRNIRAACESGWDFSSRWTGGKGLEHIRTTDILPVDLNALLYRMEVRLAAWYDKDGDSDRHRLFSDRADRRKRAVDRYCWDEKSGFYRDYDWRRGRQTDAMSMAAVVPLFTGLASQEQADRVAGRLEDDFLHDGGLVTTLTESGQQWDRPNGWAPLHWMAVKGLQQYGHDRLAREIAERWIQTNRTVFDRTGTMMEKYDVVDTARQATGGEYTVQEGFGWTNGVVMALIDEFD